MRACVCVCMHALRVCIHMYICMCAMSCDVAVVTAHLVGPVQLEGEDNLVAAAYFADEALLRAELEREWHRVQTLVSAEFKAGQRRGQDH